MSPRFELSSLAPPVAAEVAAMTFPVYRPLLSLLPATRHPEQGDERRVQPIAVVARAGAAPVGLVLGEVPLDSTGGWPEMLSLFVREDLRGQGIGTSLVAALEREVEKRGFDGISTVYTRGKPAIEALERILWKRAWEAPRRRTLSVRFSPAAWESTGLFPERRMKALSAGLELFPWRDLGEAERAEIRASHERQPWIAPLLAPWRFEASAVDPVSSVGARYRGAVVGWVLNHLVAPGTVRFTCSFMRKDLSRRGRIVPLYRESLRRANEAGYQRVTFVTPFDYPNMIRFIARWILPSAEFVGETRGSRKRLGGRAGADST